MKEPFAQSFRSGAWLPGGWIARTLRLQLSESRSLDPPLGTIGVPSIVKDLRELSDFRDRSSVISQEVEHLRVLLLRSKAVKPGVILIAPEAVDAIQFANEVRHGRP